MDPKTLEQYFALKLEAEWGPHDLKKRQDAKDPNVVVLDTRKPEFYREEHIPDAMNIPTDEVDARWTEVPKGKTVVCYCWSVTCTLAPRAALKLAQKGFNVKELVGGIEEWKDSGFPTEKTRAALAR